MKLMIPFTPHLAHECLELFNCDTINEWPIVEKNTLTEIKLPIQINGKTREVLKIKKNASQTDVEKITKKSDKIKKYLSNKDVLKTIFVQNKIINYILEK